MATIPLLKLVIPEPAPQVPECSIYHPEYDRSSGVIINPKHKARKGFTLVELSIVLVIIGLIVGGVLVGRDLIVAAEIRSQISQVEKFKAASNAFKLKYDSLAGDMLYTKAAQLGFTARGPLRARGDDNGILEGGNVNTISGDGVSQGCGETVLFWSDLSQAGLIEGIFNTATANTPPGGNVTGAAIASYYPQAKITGADNYVYAYSGGNYSAGKWVSDGRNYLGLSSVLMIRSVEICTNPSMSASYAFAIDSKLDDGLPQSGTITASIPNCIGGSPIHWASGNPSTYGSQGGSVPGVAAPASATRCYDNGNNASAANQYSTAYQNGTSLNCQLSFRLQ